MSEILLSSAAWLLAVPAAILLLLVLAGAGGVRRLQPGDGAARVLTIIPAHDESENLANILPEVLRRRGDGPSRVVVVADNCADDTAEVAARLGAEVWERADPGARGKPAALRWALKRAAQELPDAVVILDADCRIERGTLAALGRHAAGTGLPVQGRYEMPGGGLRSLAFLLKGLARQRGLARLGGAVQIQGTGFAVPWTLIERIPIPCASLVEDLEWGCRFARAGAGATYVDDFGVTSAPPASRAAEAIQQRRWEYGTLAVLTRVFPGLFLSALASRSRRRILHALDVGIPPLSLLALMLLAVAAIGWLAGRGVLAGAATGLAALAAAVLAGWVAYGRSEIGLAELLLAPWYALRKLPFYVKALFVRERGWHRTPRG